MAETIQMPKLGFDMAEGTLVTWVKSVGDSVNKGDVVAEIETDKATVEIETTLSGTLLQQLVAAGDVVPVGADIAWVGEAGEAVPDGDAPAAAPASKEAPAAAETAAAATPAPAPVSTTPVDSQLPGGVKASPLARRIAADKSVDLTQVAGTGPGGRVVKRDVESFTPATAPSVPTIAGIAAPSFTPVQASEDVEIIETSKVRRIIASRMVEAKQQVPHFYVTTEMDVADLLNLRKQLNDSLPEGATRISVNDMIVKAAALTLRNFPNLNAAFNGDQIIHHKAINIGMAVALPDGLLNVIAKDADKTSLGTMAAQNKEMIVRARDGKVRPDDIEGGTFTVSNLGPFDVDQFVAIINPPEAAILAIGAGKQVPVVLEDGTLGVGARMKITISADHRVTDGAEAAQFMQAMKKLVENPMSLLI